LKAAGCTHNNVVKTTVLLNDIKDSAAVNEVYKKFFPTNYPARTGFQVQSIFFC
jgi:2-iminobutanoate/2-iminopropanoate deaminase